MTTEKTIGPEDEGLRLDVFIANISPHLSRSKGQKYIKDGAILVNGKTVTPHIKLVAGDVVSYPASLATTPPPQHTLTPRKDIAIHVVHEDDTFVIIDKPSGLIVHPNVVEETNTLANALLAQYPEIEDVGESFERPGIMHRLDKDASGLLVVARTQEAYEVLKRQFQNHDIKKEYTVLVHGTPPEDSGTVNFPIGRVKGTGRMAAHETARDGDREAITHYRMEEQYADATLVTIRTETGRTHQIRVHMKALGTPVVGDQLYVIKNTRQLPCPRLFLHATTLGFNHPVNGEWVEFTSPLPEELNTVLARLK